MEFEAQSQSKTLESTEKCHWDHGYGETFYPMETGRV